MPPRLQVDRVAAALQTLCGKAQRAARKLLDAAAGPDGQVVMSRELVTALLQVVDQVAGAGAQLAADLVVAQLGVWGVDASVVQAPGINPDRAAARLRWAGTVPDVAGNVLGIVDELVKQPYRSTIADSAVASKVGWARVPTGPTTCSFCLMLASRGGVFTSKATAGDGSSGKKYHPHCDCVPTLIRGPQDYPAGYDPDTLYEQYLQARRTAEASGPSRISAAVDGHPRRARTVPDLACPGRGVENLVWSTCPARAT